VELDGTGRDMDAARRDAATELKRWSATWRPGQNTTYDSLEQEEFAFREIARLGTLEEIAGWIAQGMDR
jgi:hypothetical protein